MARASAYKRRLAARKAARSRRSRRSTVHFLIGAFCVLAVIGWVMNLFDKDDKAKTQASPTPAAAQTSPTVTPYFAYYDRDNTDAVIEIQRRLAELGLYDGEITGFYDTETGKAVQQFQLRHPGLQRTGFADGDTLELLFATEEEKKE